MTTFDTTKPNILHYLVSWLGMTDINACKSQENIGIGPVAQAVQQGKYDQLILLNNYPPEQISEYIRWLESIASKISIDIRQVTLTSPTNYAEIYEKVSSILDVLVNAKPSIRLTFHLSPGTPAMAAVWIILARTRFQAELIESSREHGVRSVDFPFDLSAEYLPDVARQKDARLECISAALPPLEPAFDDIIHRCRPMQRILHKAKKVSLRTLPVLIEGESGTGKELLARAIHRASPRRDAPFVAVNCGAIPSELLESELFGHVKGAFTGAHQGRAGFFETAHQGTLFLDEIGELPLSAQVKVLRALQENEIQRVGESKAVKLDIRVMAATNRDLLREVSLGRFRADLFYRLAVAVLKLPALKDRPGDLGLLMDSLLDHINREARDEPGFKHKQLTPSARNILLGHSWPGNVRELMNTLMRAAIWSDGPSISEEDILEAMLPIMDNQDGQSILNRSIEQGLDLPQVMGEVAEHYIHKALKETGGNKTKAAKMLGLKNYQTLDNWIEKYGVG